MSYEYHIGDIKKDQIFCEFDGYSQGVRYIAIEDGYLDGEYWHIKGRMDGSDKIQEFIAHKSWLHYGPELYLNSIPYNNVKYLNDE